MIERAANVGVGLMAAQPQYLHPGDRGEFIFGYGGLDAEQIMVGIDRLAQALEVSNNR